MAQRSSADPVLFAYDGSEQAKNAIQEAARQLSPGRSGIVLTVWQSPGSLPFTTGGATWARDLEDDLEAEADKVADEGARLACSVGFNAVPVAQSGNPVWQTIVASAADYDAGIVVMGSHGRTGISLVLMGSVAAAVARHTERSVLIVHTSPAAEAA
jgi:nucleotide-binding universal stress UspA family protein